MYTETKQKKKWNDYWMVESLLRYQNEKEKKEAKKVKNNHKDRVCQIFGKWKREFKIEVKSKKCKK